MNEPSLRQISLDYLKARLPWETYREVETALTADFRAMFYSLRIDETRVRMLLGSYILGEVLRARFGT
jgi:hypothetical protein